jgi:hypothetical protein
MEHHRTRIGQCTRPHRPQWSTAPALFLGLAGLATFGILSLAPSHAASVPAWLDSAISERNARHPELPIEFVDIKDSFVWYRTAKVSETDHQRIRETLYEVARANGYKENETEELVTTGRPPSPGQAHTPKKCWNRSFTLDLDPGRQRLLTTLVCSDDGYWFAGFRVAG